MSEQLGTGGMDALITERAARKAADRALVKAQAQVKEANERAELWEYRAKENGETARYFNGQQRRWRHLYEQATAGSTTNDD